MNEGVERETPGAGGESTGRGAEGYEPVNWERYLQKTPARAVIDPDGKMTPEEVVKALLKLSPKVPSWQLTSIDDAEPEGLPIGYGWLLTEHSEYWDLIDAGIRPLVRAINQLDFVKTQSSCSGHFPIDVGSQDPRGNFHLSSEGLQYREPYLTLLLDRDSPEARKLTEAIERVGRAFISKYPNFQLDIRENFFAGEGNHQVRIISLRPRISVSEAYIIENHLQLPDDLVRWTSVSKSSQAAVEAEFPRLGRVSVLQLAILQSAVREYGSYFNSGEPEKILQEFYRALELEIKTACSPEK